MSYKYSELQIGDKESFSKTITDADVLMFAAVSGDMNELHMNEEYGKTTWFGHRIAHGALTSALIPAALTKAFPGSIYISQYVEFTGPVYIGDTLTSVVTCLEKKEKRHVIMETDVINQRGEYVLKGKAETKLAREE